MLEHHSWIFSIKILPSRHSPCITVTSKIYNSQHTPITTYSSANNSYAAEERAKKIRQNTLTFWSSECCQFPPTLGYVFSCAGAAAAMMCLSQHYPRQQQQQRQHHSIYLKSVPFLSM